MRMGLLLVAAAAVASCAPTAPPMAQAQYAQTRLSQLLAGRSAGPTQNCINRLPANDMIVIDDNVVLFKSGATYYLNDFKGQGCTGLSRPGYAMVTKSFSGSQICSGEIASIQDTANGMMIGSCAFGEFVPYRRP